MWSAVALLSMVAVFAGGQEIYPTRVLTGDPKSTVPPPEVVRPQYAQTLYKATDFSIAMNTLIPFWPASSVEYQNTTILIPILQNITTSTAEFSTRMNSTVEFYDSITSNTSVAATTYQTMEFQHQTVIYTDMTQNITQTQIQDNGLPFV